MDRSACNVDMSSRMQARAIPVRRVGRAAAVSGEVRDRATGVKGQDLTRDAGAVEAGIGKLLGRRSVGNEGIGQHQVSYPDVAQEIALGKMVQDMGAKPANRAFFHSDHQFMAAGQPLHQSRIERLAEPRIGDRSRDAVVGKIARGLEAGLKPRPDAENRHIGTLRS